MKTTHLAVTMAAVLLGLSGMALAQETTIHVMSWTTTQAPGVEYWEEITKGFEEQHPGVKIETNFVPFNQYLPTLGSMIAGDSLPDVFYGHVKVAELGRAGKVIDWADHVDQAYLDAFYPGALRQFNFDNGHIYALPWTALNLGIFTNDRIMQENGLSAPETWSELIEMVPKLRGAGLTPLAFGNVARNSCLDLFMMLVAQYGGDGYALDDLTRPGVTWNSPPVVNALTLLDRMAKAGVFLDGVNGIDDSQAWQLAYRGQAAMVFTGSWGPSIFAGEGSEDWLKNYSVHQLPVVNEGDTKYSGNGSGEGWAVNANSPNRDIAIEFVRYLFSPEVYDEHVAGLGAFPSRPDGLDKVAEPHLAEMVSWMDTDGANHILFGAGTYDAVANVCQGVLDGSIEPAAGAAQIQADVLATRSGAPK